MRSQSRHDSIGCWRLIICRSWGTLGLDAGVNEQPITTPTPAQPALVSIEKTPSLEPYGAFSALSRTCPLGTDRVELVNEDDRGLLLLRQGEGVAHELRAVADEHLDQLRAAGAP